jgi:hypothetical protein
VLLALDKVFNKNMVIDRSNVTGNTTKILKCIEAIIRVAAINESRYFLK